VRRFARGSFPANALKQVLGEFNPARELSLRHRRETFAKTGSDSVIKGDRFHVMGFVYLFNLCKTTESMMRAATIATQINAKSNVL